MILALIRGVLACWATLGIAAYAALLIFTAVRNPTTTVTRSLAKASVASAPSDIVVSGRILCQAVAVAQQTPTDSLRCQWCHRQPHDNVLDLLFAVSFPNDFAQLLCHNHTGRSNEHSNITFNCLPYICMDVRRFSRSWAAGLDEADICCLRLFRAIYTATEFALHLPSFTNSPDTRFNYLASIRST